MQFIFAFLFFSFGRLVFAASTLSFLCGLLSHVEGAVVASISFGMGGIRRIRYDFSRFLHRQHCFRRQFNDRTASLCGSSRAYFGSRPYSAGAMCCRMVIVVSGDLGACKFSCFILGQFTSMFLIRSRSSMRFLLASCGVKDTRCACAIHCPLAIRVPADAPLSLL